MQYLGTQRAQLRKLVKPTGKRLWMSEFGCGSSPPSDMGAALELSAMIMRVRHTARTIEFTISRMRMHISPALAALCYRICSWVTRVWLRVLPAIRHGRCSEAVRHYYENTQLQDRCILASLLMDILH